MKEQRAQNGGSQAHIRETGGRDTSQSEQCWFADH
jgi:hypothetical protein